MYNLRIIIPDDVANTEIDNDYNNLDDLKNEVEIYLYEMTCSYELTVFVEENIKMTIKVYTSCPTKVIYEPEIGIFQNVTFTEPKCYDENIKWEYEYELNINCTKMIIPFMIKYLQLSEIVNELVDFVD